MIGKQLVSQIPWGHNILSIQKLKRIIEMKFYKERVGDKEGIAFKAIRKSILLGVYRENKAI